MSPSLSDLNPSTKRRVLVYGKVGTGKTVFACSFPGRKYIADFDGKISSAAEFYAGSERLKEIDYDEYKSARPFNRFDIWLRNATEAATKGSFPYQTVVVDSLTELISSALDDFIAANGAIQRTRTSIGPISSMLDYRALAIQIRGLYNRLFSLPAHIVTLAHLRTEKDELTGQIVNGPEGPAGVVTHLQIIFEEVYRSYVDGEGEKRRYLAQTQATSQFPARSQIKGLPQVIDLSYESLRRFERPS